MKCSKAASLFYHYIDKNIPPELLEEFQDHIAACNDCTARLNEIKSSLQDAASYPEQQASAELFEAVSDELEKLPKPEVLSEKKNSKPFPWKFILTCVIVLLAGYGVLKSNLLTWFVDRYFAENTPLPAVVPSAAPVPSAAVPAEQLAVSTAAAGGQQAAVHSVAAHEPGRAEQAQGHQAEVQHQAEIPVPAPATARKPKEKDEESTAMVLYAKDRPFHDFELQGDNSGFTEPTTVAIDSEEKWEELWATHTENIAPPPVMPTINFQQYVIIAVFAGEKNTEGAALDLVSVKKYPGRIVVTYRDIIPKEGASETEQTIQPYHMIAIENYGLPIEFKKLTSN